MRGVTGFDFQGYNQRFISNASGQPVNDSVSYGVGVHAVNAPTGTSYWAVVGVHHLTPEENRSRHNIFVDVLDEQGQRLRDAQVAWNWESNGGAPPEPKRLDKPDDEPGCDIPLFDGTFKLGLWARPAKKSSVFMLGTPMSQRPTENCSTRWVITRSMLFFSGRVRELHSRWMAVR